MEFLCSYCAIIYEFQVDKIECFFKLCDICKLDIDDFEG